jgi:GNAT superfamily N-acetyltransferase
MPERYLVGNIHRPFSAPPDVVERFPSHLYVNLVPRMQGRGTGRQLVATLMSGLRGQGPRGVHLLVGHANKRAPGFYRHIGCTELPATGSHIFGMCLAAEDAQSPG